MRYRCEICGAIYEHNTQDGMCANIKCWGEQLVRCPDGSSEANADGTPVEVEEAAVGVVQGLCILLCDASRSMDTTAFVKNDLVKLRMVTRAVHRAIAELSQITNPDEAFICIIAFGAKAALVPDRAGNPFIMSVSDIKAQFGDDSLGDYLYESLANDKPGIDRQYTDITAALQLAREVYDSAVAGDLAAFGLTNTVRILKHKDIVTDDRRQISVPNVRVMLYSDGEHNPQKADVLANPFEPLNPSVLMTAFIGDESANESSRRGADQMRALANTCPVHGKKGYFLINSPERYAVLRMLFRMASGASGFCTECLMGFIKSLEDESTSYG